MSHSRTIRSERHERLSHVIRRDAVVLIDTWGQRAADEQPSARRVHHDALLDHLPAFLQALAESLAAADSDKAQQYRQPAFHHGEQRWENGWSLPELVRDYQLLRTVLFEHLDEAIERPLKLRELLAVNLAFDEAIAASAGMYVANRDETVRQMERERVERERGAEEQRLRRQAEALREVDRRKDEFLAVLGHELRNPLAPIRNVVQALQLKAPDPATLHWATGVVERQVRHMTRLVDDLLDLTRISRGKIQLRPERVELGAQVRVVAEDQRAAHEAAGLRLLAEVPAEPVPVRGDPVRLAQVLNNLLHNAMKFTTAGGEVRVRLDRDEPAGRAIVTVSDTGMGIDAAELPHLFETFRQAERSRHQSRGGLGLGLALVKGLVELHGGTVTAASEGPGRGSRFTFWLPLDPGPAALPPAPPLP